MCSDVPTIPEFYQDKKIFITGGSGFMGRVLIEKLLRSCPDLNTIYLLLRPKKGRDVSTRIRDITDVALFDRLRQENPGALNKLVAVSGDVTELGLGISEEDRRMLQDEVSIIFHSAASVRFDDSIRDAVQINVRGTREVVNLALGMKHLQVLQHISTTYCNFDKPVVHEQLYPAPGDWRTMIAFVNRVKDDDVLRSLTPKLLGSLPNTYTLTKALAEHVINDHKDRIPVVIFRPSIVTPTLHEPIPGWVDNLNGPFSIYVPAGKGVMRTFCGNFNEMSNFVPVDLSIKAMIYLAYLRVTNSNPRDLEVYNCSTMVIPFSNGYILNKAIEYARHTIPLEGAIWYPQCTFTTSRACNFFKLVLFHLLPAMLVDGLLKLKGQKTKLMKVTRKIYAANNQMMVFTNRSANFDNTLFRSACSHMQDSDRKEFYYNEIVEDFDSYSQDSCAGIKLHVFKESMSSLPETLAHIRRLYWLDLATKAFSYSLLFWGLGFCSRMRTAIEIVSDMVY